MVNVTEMMIVGLLVMIVGLLMMGELQVMMMMIVMGL